MNISDQILLTGGKFIQKYTATANKTSMVWGDTIAFTITPSPVLKANKQIFWKLIGNTTITSSMVRSGGIQGSPTMVANTPLTVTLVTDVVKTSGLQIRLVMAETSADLTAGTYKASSPLVNMTISPTSSATLSTVGSSTWTVPTNVYKITATIDAAGGGAGGPYFFYGSTGGPGGNGGRITYTVYTTPGTQYGYTVGSGGQGGGDALNGSSGTNSVFNNNTAIAGGGGFSSSVRGGLGASGTNGGNGLGSPGGQTSGATGTNGKIVINW